MLKILYVTTILTIGLCGCASNPESITQNGTAKSASTNTNENKAGTHLLDGKIINWAYNGTDAGMNVSFENGLAQYEWITGPRKGNSDQNIPYNSRKIGDEMYLINWVQPQKPDFLTFIFDFKNKTVFTSGLIGYGTERQRNLFRDGTINSITD